jgi:hypothetical protein
VEASPQQFVTVFGWRILLDDSENVSTGAMAMMSSFPACKIDYVYFFVVAE